MTLRFLTLAGNQIDKIENLRILDELKFLDLSENQIESFDPGKKPYLKVAVCIVSRVSVYWSLEQFYVI